MLAGMMPILHRPGEMMPGQFGPISREFFDFRYSHTFTMSSAGIPSEMQTISGRPASAASIIASAAPGGGTKITVAFAPVLATASLTVLKMGQPRVLFRLCPESRRPLPAFHTPAKPWREMFLHGLSVPAQPVASIYQPGCSLDPLCRRDDFLGRVFHGLCHDEIESACLQDFPALFDVRAFQPQHDGQLDVRLLRGAHHAVG